MNGKSVKLVQGDSSKKEFETDATKLAEEFSIYPEINLIDLDAALGKGENLELIEKICKICNCNIGGGIRSIEKAYELLKLGANKIIIGTRAEKSFLSKLPKEKIIVAIDSRNGKITDKGWKNQREETPFELVKNLSEYCSGFLYTCVEKEGTMEAVDFETIKKLRKLTDKKIMYAGGVSDSKEIIELEKLNTDCVIGMAYYKNKINLEESFVMLLNFEKNNGIIPTIVKDEYGQVLMLAYSTKESVLEALKTRKGMYYSRSRKKLWEKGETLGNTQELIRVETDCDRDTLIYTVKQKNFACHKGEYSCFSGKEFTMNSLMQIIRSKKGSGSFTGKIMEDEKYLNEKIMEEAMEVINFRDIENLKWEIVDLLYFVSVKMEKYGLDYKDIENELATRHSRKSLSID